MTALTSRSPALALVALAAARGRLLQGGAAAAAAGAAGHRRSRWSRRTFPTCRASSRRPRARARSNIVARVSGFLDKIAYQEGEVVKEGQLLFQLDPKPFQAQLDAARGELQAQQARFTTAQANLGRVKPLAEQNALSQADLDRAQGRVRLGQGRGVRRAGEGEGGRAQSRLRHDPLAGDRPREPLAAAPGRVRQLACPTARTSPTSPRSIRSG